MRTLLIFLMPLLLCWFSLAGQDLRNSQWILGGTSGGNGILVNFNTTPLNLTWQNTGIKMEGSNSSMCDAEGKLLFYSNGCLIANAANETMENGDSINGGLMQSIYCPAGGSPYIQGVLSVPAPGSDSLYYVFNLDMDDPYFMVPGVLGIAPVTLYYSIIDMSRNSGLGAVLQKRQIAIQDTLARGNIQAVRHANETDWWIITPESHSNCYFLTLVTQEGVQPAQKVCAGVPWSDDDSPAQCVFTPDGKKYIRFNKGNGLHIYDFDRAAGYLSNQLVIEFPNDTFNVAGVAVAPNSRYLYATTLKKVYQFDLQANDISATQTLIATWDGYVNPYPTIFFLEALAPDGKIYIASTSSTQNLHVIHRPNCPGLSCNLEQHGVDLPGYNYISVPNFPQYVQSNLTADCDTLTNTVISQNKSTSLLVFPNPVSEILYLQTDNYKNAWQLINQLGQVVLSGKELPESIDCSRLPPAVYFLRVGGNRTSVVKW